MIFESTINRRSKIKDLPDDGSDDRSYLQHWFLDSRFIYAATGIYAVRFPVEFKEEPNKPADLPVQVPHGAVLQAQKECYKDVPFQLRFDGTDWVTRSGTKFSPAPPCVYTKGIVETLTKNFKDLEKPSHELGLDYKALHKLASAVVPGREFDQMRIGFNEKNAAHSVSHVGSPVLQAIIMPIRL